MPNTVLITGANRGIGYELAKLYHSNGWDVIAVCRHQSPQLAELNTRVISDIDVASAQSIASLKEALGSQKLDLLINNAGILRDERLGEINYETLEQQFWVNAVGPLRVTEALLSNLKQGSKVALITSRMGSITDNTSGGRYGYRMSKAALNAAAMSLTQDLKPKGISVAILHPGYVATEMVGGHGDISPELAAERLSQRIDGLTMNNTGTFWHSNGEVLPW